MAPTRGQQRPQGDEDAAWAAYWSDRSIERRNALVQMYRPVALAVARHSLDYARSVSSAMANLDDLEGIAQEALIRAVERFDPTKGARSGRPPRQSRPLPAC